MICTVLGTLTAVVFCMGMQANASASAIRQIKIWMMGISVLSLVALVAAGFLMHAGQPESAAGVAFAPTVVLGILLIVALLK